MQMPKVTVLMSVYNGEKFLREAMESILNQTFKDFEFIIINDGSTDSSRDIILSYNDLRIMLIDNEKNIGLTRSLNKGLRIVKGEYIARQDADDISFPKRLEKQVKFLNTHKDVGLVGSSYMLIDEKGNKVQNRVKTKSEELKKDLWKGNRFCHGSVIFRKDCVKKVGFYREEFKASQDYDLWLRISEFWNMANIKDLLYGLRVNVRSISVLNKFEQERYASLAKILAKQKKMYGKDKLDTYNKDKIEDILCRILPKNKHNEKIFLANGYFNGADLLYFSKNYSESKKWLLKSLSSNYFNIKTWVLLLKVMICLGLSPKIIKYLKLVREQLLLFIKKEW